MSMFDALSRCYSYCGVLCSTEYLVPALSNLFSSVSAAAVVYYSNVDCHSASLTLLFVAGNGRQSSHPVHWDAASKIKKQ